MAAIATPQSDLLRPDQAAQFLRVSAATLAAWRSSGRQPTLRFVRVGGRIAYRLADLEKFLESRTVGQ
jgi:predicted site-specific integrase-resolvase